jgi:hypothetical protein
MFLKPTSHAERPPGVLPEVVLHALSWGRKLVTARCSDRGPVSSPGFLPMRTLLPSPLNEKGVSDLRLRDARS